MTLRISREDITLAAESIDLNEDNYRIRESYTSRHGATGGGIDLLDSGKVTEFMVALAVQLAEDGRGADARSLARLTRTDRMGFGVAVYWPGVEVVV